jgi:hypothetical protein
MTKKRNELLLQSRRLLAVAITVIVAGPLGAAYCQTSGPVLLLQQTPVDGGTMTPEAGVHRFELYTDVTLSAVAKPGYQFVYWLGDVSDPTSATTIVHLDAPKIVIAVYERTEYEFLRGTELITSIPIGGAVASSGDYRRVGFGGPVLRRPAGRSAQVPFEPPETPEFPVPEPEPAELPVPVPEPATVALLGLGSALVCSLRKTKRKWNNNNDCRTEVVRRTEF